MGGEWVEQLPVTVVRQQIPEIGQTVNKERICRQERRNFLQLGRPNSCAAKIYLFICDPFWHRACCLLMTGPPLTFPTIRRSKLYEE